MEGDYNGYGVPFEGNENVLELDRNGGHTTLCMYDTYCIVHFKMVGFFIM